MRFHIGADVHYGWIRVNMPTDLSYLNLHDWAYQETPGAGISSDLNLPTPSISSAWSGLSNVALNTVTITFDEAVTGLSIDSLQLTNGTASNLQEISAGVQYTVDITANIDGEVRVELPATAVTDADLNPLTTHASSSWMYDASAPIATIDPALMHTSDQTITVSVNFNEPISGLTADDFNISNGTAANLIEVSTGTEYTLDVSATIEDTVTVELPANAVNDTAGNGNTAAETSYVYDDGVNGLNTLSQATIKVYPNPTSSLLHMELHEASDIRILQTNGQLVLERTNITNEVLDLGHLAAGSYILHIQNNKGVATESIIIY